MSFLEQVKYPDDLRKLKKSDLQMLASEIRERIVSVVSESGGHLASSLGAVELTLALHYIFQTPKDKIIWDVGHQTYAHKIITGRNQQFSTIRQQGGLSGFPRLEESEYDCVSVGHAGTSISEALGMAIARDLLAEDYHVVAVIGDGSMTSGLAYEGLNNAGARKTNLTVVLNDNSMSISKNVGAMSHYLTRVISDPLFNKIKKDVWELTGRLSKIGKSLRTVVASIEDSVKHLMIPGKLFEDLGFRYFGIIDGHNLNELIEVFRNVKNNVSGPVLIHVQTTKGKGCEFAEKDATRFHGVGKFEKESGKVKTSETKAITYTQAFASTLVRLARDHKELVGITAAMPDGTGLIDFSREFPSRFFDVGIAESHAVTFAAGMALRGLRPVVAIYSSFLQRSFDQIIHDVALDQLPVIFCIDRAGLVGDDGPTHHGAFDLSYLNLIPNLVIMAPKDEAELCHMLYSATLYKKGPVCIRYPRGVGHGLPLPEKLQNIPVGEFEVINPGEKILVLAIGEMVYPCMETIPLLKSHRIHPTLVNARFVKPLNNPQLSKLIGEHDCIVTVESNTLIGGFGSNISRMTQALDGKKKILNLGYPDAFIEHGNRALLFEKLGLNPAGIAKQILELVSKTESF